MWAHLQRQGIPRGPLHRGTPHVRANHWKGVARRKKVRTIVRYPAAARAGDLGKSRFWVLASNMLLAQISLQAPGKRAVRIHRFALAAYAGNAGGWTCSASKEDRFARQAIQHTPQLRSID